MSRQINIALYPSDREEVKYGGKDRIIKQYPMQTSRMTFPIRFFIFTISHLPSLVCNPPRMETILDLKSRLLDQSSCRISSSHISQTHVTFRKADSKVNNRSAEKMAKFFEKTNTRDY